MIYQLSHPLVRIYWRVVRPKTFGSKGIILHKEKVMLTKNIPVDYWMLPGGMIDKNESPENCIKRELQEELNLNIKQIDYQLGKYTSNNEGKKDTIFVFVINLENEYFEKQWEIKDAQWFYLNDLPKNISPATSRRINELKEHKKNIETTW